MTDKASVKEANCSAIVLEGSDVHLWSEWFVCSMQCMPVCPFKLGGKLRKATISNERAG